MWIRECLFCQMSEVQSKKRRCGGEFISRFTPTANDLETERIRWSEWKNTVKDFYKCQSSSLFSMFHHKDSDKRPYVTVQVFNTTVHSLFDSGANNTILGKFGLYLIDVYHLKLTSNSRMETLKTADGKNQNVLGTVDLPITVDGITKVLRVIASNSIETNLILGIDFCYAFKISTNFSTDSFTVCSVNSSTAIKGADDLNPQQRIALSNIVALFKGISGEQLGRTNKVMHKIDTGTADPIKQRYYPLSPAMQSHANDALDRMLEAGIVRKSSSPWNSPMVLVKKKDNSYRLCFDGRKLNSVTKKDAYPLPYLTTILDKLRDAHYLTSIDLRQAFYQIPLHPESCEKTAFTVPKRGLFEYTVMPFGIANAPATQQRLMDYIFGNLLGENLFVYLDDIIVVSQTFDEHITILKEVYRRLKEANLTVNIEKCDFCKSRLSYLGYVVDKDGLHTDPQKVEAISLYPKPKTVTDIKRFIGMCSWYRRFVYNFSTVIAPLSNLIKGKTKKQVVSWTREAEESFARIKSLLTSTPILSSPDFSKPFSLQCDASDFGLGCVLTQGDNDEETVIAYASRTLNKAERNYTVTERELLAVIFAIEKFRAYIEGTHFTVYTDHHALIWLHNIKEPAGRLARWSIKLSQFSFTIKHRKGKCNVVPDALSRAPLEVNAIQVTENEFDPWYRKMLIKVTEHPQNFPDWKVEDGLLFKYVPIKHNILSNLIEWRRVVPKCARGEILRLCHDEPTSGHFGVTKTYHKLCEEYYWPKMKADTKQYVRRCDICAASKSSNQLRPGLMGKEKKVDFPFQCLSIDLMGPFPKSPRGNTSLIVVCDWLTKFVVVKTLRTTTAKSIINFLENEVFLIYGVPQICMMDNGPQFISKDFKSFLQNYKVQQSWYNASYHPQVNYVERVNRVIGTAIRSYVKENHRDWDLHIYKVAHAIRNSVHDVTGFTPSFLNFGRSVPVSGDYYGKLKNLREEELSIGNRERLVDNINKLSALHQNIVNKLSVAYRKYSKHYNLRKRPLSFKTGDVVWKKNYAISDATKHYSQKLAPKYIKCKVKEVTGPLTYRLINEHGKDVGLWHIKDLKPISA
uniref:RNA-directed DNA polymerase n=2 Tax=Photinus pyralis TaxID=7054 RepID=A0A1Y1K180_PHOPY